jgi:hypothetical protein
MFFVCPINDNSYVIILAVFVDDEPASFASRPEAETVVRAEH